MVLANYRGYGNSDGRPSEKAIISDAKITLQMVREHYPDRPVILMGESLGSAVAIRIVDSKIDGMILISPFRSIAHVASRSILRIVPMQMLIRHKFDTQAHLSSLPDKVLVVYSKYDGIVLAQETERVLERIPQADVILDDAERHVSVLGENFRKIGEWLAENFKN